MSTIIRVQDLSRTYGAVQAVASLSFDVEEGQVVGFVGANGAGKTTTMRIMATLEMPSQGRVEICGYDVVNYPGEVRQCIGWMPDAYGSYDHVTVHEYLDFFGRAFGYRAKERAMRVEEVMAFADLGPIADRQMKELSKGMGQRLCLGRTLLNDPAVLILDEPAAGLDPKARLDLIRLIRLLAEDGKTIFISSHILSELGQMCDTMLFIDQGRLVHHGSAESLTRQAKGGVLVVVTVVGDAEKLREWTEMNPGVRFVDDLKEGGRLAFVDESPESLSAHLHKMLNDGLQVTEFHQEKRRLEDAFISMLTKGGPPPIPESPPRHV